MTNTTALARAKKLAESHGLTQEAAEALDQLIADIYAPRVARARKAFETAREKGRKARREDVPIDFCPYPDVHEVPGIWAGHWRAGWLEADGQAGAS